MKIEILWVPFMLFLSWANDWNAACAFIAGMWASIILAQWWGWRKVEGKP